MDTVLSPVWKRTSTATRILRHGAVEQVPLDLERLKKELERDTAQQESVSLLAFSAPEARRHRAYSLLARLPHRISR